MEYMILIHSDESYEAPTPGTPEFEEFMGAFLAYNQSLIDGGHWIGAANLQPSMTATTVRKSLGAASTVVDGPFAESKEQLGGYYVVSAADLDEVIALVEALPIPMASFEIRPIAFRPDAG